MKVRTLEDPGLDDADRRLIENVARYGTHVVKVGSAKPTPTPDWAYTIGLHLSSGHPEVVVFGLKAEVAHTLLNDVRDLVAEGHRFEDGSESDRVLDGLSCAFRAIQPLRPDPYSGVMRWFHHREPVPVVQMFWPDRENRFPWQPGFDPKFEEKQPLLYEDDPEAARNTEFLRELEEIGHRPPRPGG